LSSSASHPKWRPVVLGDIVELDDPPREARVLSTRLQLTRNQARVLIVLDVPDEPDDVLRRDTPIDVLFGDDIDESLPVSDEIDDELEKLTDEVRLEPAPDEARPQVGRSDARRCPSPGHRAA
jgi:hypothetical protein